VVGGILIYYFNIYWIDPLLTVIIGLYILRESYKILKQAVNILMQGTPKNLDINKLIDELEKIDIIKDFHHVHIWSLDENTVFFEAHVNLKNDVFVSEISEVYEKLKHELKERFGVTHITLQVEYNCCENLGRVIKKG
jgi:cobalt-zinc-cadmium efflux system protein